MSKQEFIDGVRRLASDELAIDSEEVEAIMGFDPVLGAKIQALVDQLVDVRTYCKGKIEAK